MLNRPSFVIWGSAGHAMVLADTIGQNGGDIVALFDNNIDATSSLAGVPLFFGKEGFEKWLSKQLPFQKFFAALAIGGARGGDRHQIANYLIEKGLQIPTLIHSSSCVSPSSRLGEGCQVLSQAVVAANASLGEMCIINNSATVDHECDLGHGVHIAPGATLCGCVSVGDYSMIGAGAVILPRIRIGKNVVVGAGAVVTRDIPNNQTVAGNPAKQIEGRK